MISLIGWLYSEQRFGDATIELDEEYWNYLLEE